MRSFKRAVIVTLLFALVMGAGFTAVAEVYFNTNTYYYQDSDAREELAGQIDTLICGGSHGFRAFVPSVLDEEMGVCSYNLSGALMTMKGRYTLVKKELERNDIDTVIIELSYNATTRDRKTEGPEGDLYVLGRLDSMPERLGYFFTSMYINEYDRVLYDTFNRGIESIIALVRNGTEYDHTLTKGYRPVGSKSCTTTVESYLKNFKRTSFRENETEYNLRYLELIAELCNQHGVRTVVVVTPVNDRYLYQHSNLDTVMSMHSKWAQEHGFEYYDMNLIKTKNELFDENTAYYDDSHLSKDASEVFSKEIAVIMNEAKAGKDVSGYFYSSYEEAEKNGKYRLLAENVQ